MSLIQLDAAVARGFCGFVTVSFFFEKVSFSSKRFLFSSSRTRCENLAQAKLELEACELPKSKLKTLEDSSIVYALKRLLLVQFGLQTLVLDNASPLLAIQRYPGWVGELKQCMHGQDWALRLYSRVEPTAHSPKTRDPCLKPSKPSFVGQGVLTFYLKLHGPSKLRVWLARGRDCTQGDGC